MKTMAMMNKKVEGTYAVDYINEKIYVSKKFLKAASVVGTGAFEAMMVLKQTYPAYEMEIKEIAKNNNKVSYEGLSIEKMLAFITVEKDQNAVAEFERYIEVYTDKSTRNIQKGKYSTIKKLFLNRYKEEYAALSDEKMVDVDEKAAEIKKQREEKKAADLKAIRKAELEAARNKVVELKIAQ